MKTSSVAVVACASCGALHSPAPGDQDLCPACRKLLPAQPPWRGAPPAGAPGQPIGAFSKRAGKGNGRAAVARGRTVRLAAIAAAIALAAVGGALALPRKPLADAWTAMRRNPAADAWAKARRSASELWIGVRARIPFFAPQADAAPRVAPAKPPAHQVRHATAAGVPGRRSQKKVPAKKTKRSAGDANAAAGTP